MGLKVRVRDFQSIEDASILIDRLTVITGTNNAGKSAFFRAIRGALTNARGYDFVRYGAKHCTVDIEDTETGHTLTWMKGKGVNTYIVDGKELPKVGLGVPQEAQIFGVESIQAGNSELWPQIASQIVGVSFLLHETGSVVAEAVADVDRVNQLSRALKGCESDRRSNKASLKVRRKDAQVFGEKMERFSGLDAAVEAASGLEARHQKAEKIAKANVNLIRLGERVGRARSDVRALQGLEGVSARLPTQERVRESQETSKRHAEGVHLRQRFKRAQDSVTRLKDLDGVVSLLPSESRVDYIHQFRKAIGVTVGLAVRVEESRKELARAEKAQGALDVVSLDSKKLNHLHKFKKGLDNARQLGARYLEQHSAVKLLDRQIETMEKEHTGLVEQLSKVLGVYQECPTCGGNLDHVH